MAIRVNYYLNKKRTTTTINTVLARYFCSAWAINNGKSDDFFTKKKDISWLDKDEKGYNPDDYWRNDEQLRKILQLFITGVTKGRVITDSSQIDDIICRYVFECEPKYKKMKDIEYFEYIKSREYRS